MLGWFDGCLIPCLTRQRLRLRLGSLLLAVLVGPPSLAVFTSLGGLFSRLFVGVRQFSECALVAFLCFCGFLAGLRFSENSGFRESGRQGAT